MSINFYGGIDAALLSSTQNGFEQAKASLRQLMINRQVKPQGSAHSLSSVARDALTKLMGVLPPKTKFRHIGYELAKVDPNDPKKIDPDGNTARLGLKFNLSKVEGGEFPLSVCGGKKAVTFQRFAIKNPKSTDNEWEDTVGISDAVMLIADSPVHHHGHTEERYTALAPTDGEGKTVSFDESKPIALMYLEDPATKQYEIHPLNVGDTLILKPGLIHGSTALQGETTKYHLQFSPGLVVRPDLDKPTDPLQIQRARNRDEAVIYPSTLARIKEVIAESI